MTEERFTENDFKEVDMKKDIKYCLTEISKELTDELIEFSKIYTNEVYDKAFWDKVVKSMKEEDERYVRQCEAMMIDPISGKSTASWEYMQKRFTI